MCILTLGQPSHGYQKISEVLDYCFVINMVCLKRREADHENIPLSLYALSRQAACSVELNGASLMCC